MRASAIQSNLMFGNPDPYGANVVLLMHFDGDYVDKSPLAQAFTSTGTTLSAAGAKFTQSVAINGTNPGGGGSNGVQSNSSRSEYDVTTGDMTMEAWVKPDSTVPNGGGGRPIISLTTSGIGNGGAVISLYGDATGTFFRFDINGTFTMSSATSSVYLTTGTWYHVAVSRQGITTRLFVNGALVDSATNGVWGSATSRVAVIGNFFGGTQGLHGKVDEARVTKAARYTAAFMPPDSPF